MTSQAPRLSFVVVVYAIPRQAENTLFSLSPAYQRHVRADDYEVIVVENRSATLLGEDRVKAAGPNFRYVLRDEPGVSPVRALNEGVALARAPHVALMIDGARLLTPRVVEHALLALRISDRVVVAVPGYHLGKEPQHLAARAGYDETAELELLERSAWRTDGYALFGVACFDETNENGFLNPMIESTCLICSRAAYAETGGADPRFSSRGGGIVNLDLFDRLCRAPDTTYVVLPGEGAIHQFHGGVTSSSDGERELRLADFRAEYEALRGHPYTNHDREPLLVGVIAGQGQPFLHRAADLGRLRHLMRAKDGQPEWNP